MQGPSSGPPEVSAGLLLATSLLHFPSLRNSCHGLQFAHMLIWITSHISTHADPHWQWHHFVATSVFKELCSCLLLVLFVHIQTSAHPLSSFYVLLLLCFWAIIFPVCLLDVFECLLSPSHFYSMQGGWGWHHLRRVRNCASPKSTVYKPRLERPWRWLLSRVPRPWL